MTTSAEQADKKQAAEALKARDAALAAKEAKANEGRTGKGTRVFFGMTRGRNPQEISYEAFDDSKPDTLPTSVDEFMELTKVKDEPVIVSYLIEGFNSLSYTSASDPVSEYINEQWDDERKKQFRIVVRNYASNAGVSIEEAVNLIKPGIEAAFLKSQEGK